MTWFKVDDKAHSHRKMIRAGVGPVGLWTLAGSWCSDQLTDGWVPDYIAARIDPTDHEHNTLRLVAVGLWVPGEHQGETGWWFHDWHDQQPSREQVLAERKAAAERQRRARERAKQRRDNPDRHGVTHGDVTPAVTVPPTRPDPKGQGRGGEPTSPPPDNPHWRTLAAPHELDPEQRDLNGTGSARARAALNQPRNGPPTR